MLQVADLIFELLYLVFQFLGYAIVLLLGLLEVEVFELEFFDLSFLVADDFGIVDFCV